MAQATGPGGIMAFAPLLIIMVIFYVLLILPAQRRQKKTTEMLTALKNGDKVITNGGVFGTIVGTGGRRDPAPHRRPGEGEGPALRRGQPPTRKQGGVVRPGKRSIPYNFCEL